MWQIETEAISSNTIKYKIFEDGKFISFEKWIDHLKHSDTFIEFI